MDFLSDTWCDFFVFGVFVSAANGMIYHFFKDADKIDFDLIRNGLFSSIFFNGISYNLGNSTNESLSIAFAGIAINVLLMIWFIISKRK
jgi:hypothetical protein